MGHYNHNLEYGEITPKPNLKGKRVCFSEIQQ